MQARFQYVRECADAFASDRDVNPVLVVDSDVGTPAREKKESRKKSDKPAGEVSHKKRRGQFEERIPKTDAGEV